MHAFKFLGKIVFPANLFTPLTSLDSIDLRSNFIKHPLDFTTRILSKIVWQFPLTIKSISIDVPAEQEFPEIFANFTQLEEFSVYFQTRQHFKIFNDTFKPLINSSIKSLILKCWGLTGIEPLAFAWFPHLESLELNNANGLSIADLYPAWYGLRNTKLKVLNLSNFRKESQRTYSLKLNSTFFSNIQIPSLTKMSLDFTGIGCAEKWEFSRKIPSLEYLSMKTNQMNLSEIQKLITKDLQRMQNLTFLDLSDQSPMVVSIQNKVLLTIKLPPNLQTLYLNGTTVWSSSVHTQDNIMSLQLNNSNNLKYLNYDYNSVDRFTEHFMFQPNPNISFVASFDYNQLNSLKFLEESLRRGLKIQALSLWHNQFGDTLAKRDSQNMFENHTGLEVLNLRSNQIKSLPDEIFNNQRQLLYLYLHENFIKDLPKLIFKHQTKLKVLKLQSNYLWRIQFDFTHMTQLVVLDLSENSFTQLNTETQQKLDELRSISPNFTLNFNGNPLECSCSTLPFMRWAKNRRSMFQGYHFLECIYNDTKVGFDQIQELIRELDFQCSMNLAVKLAAGLLVFAIVITGVSVFLYRHRWDVRFFCIKFVARRNEYVEHEGYRSLFEYDAFVAYHKDDLKWVQHELFKHLDTEGREGDLDDQTIRFRLCIHDRDFIPGVSIEDNIVRAIENSRKTILVLSQKFLTSGWCEFELQMARMESFDKGRNLIIAVMLEPLEIEKMSKSLKLLIRRNTYIEWFKNPENRENFWKKIRFALETEKDF